MNIRSFISSTLLIAFFAAPTVGKAQNKTLTFTISGTGVAIQNKFSDLTTWSFQRSWLKQADGQPANYFANNYPFIKYVQLMTATGGSLQRDLFIDPADRTTLTDYNFAPLITACQNILKQGLKPYIVTGNVPLKFTSAPAFGEFEVNVRPPDNYNDYYNYIKAIADALVKQFGINTVKQWRWGVLTEYENGGWFKDADGTPESTMTNYFKLYDYTVAALQAAIGKANLKVGAHSMTMVPGLWDELTFIDHCAKQRNYKTGQIGTQINFLTGSLYENTPGVYKGKLLVNCINTLRERAEQNGLKNLTYGIDEGGILYGQDGKELVNRVIPLSYQGAATAKRFKEMILYKISWFATWSLNTEGVWNGINSVYSNVCNLAYKMVGENYLNAVPANKAANNIDGVGGYSHVKHKAHILLYNYTTNINSADKKSVTVVIKNVSAVAGKKILVKRYIVDDDHSNWWGAWNNDEKNRRLGDSDYYKGKSRFSVEIGQSLVTDENRAYWKLKSKNYIKLSQMEPEVIPATLVNKTLTFSTNVQDNGVVMYEFTNVN